MGRRRGGRFPGFADHKADDHEALIVIAIVVYQQIENYNILQPTIIGKASWLSGRFSG